MNEETLGIHLYWCTVSVLAVTGLRIPSGYFTTVHCCLLLQRVLQRASINHNQIINLVFTLPLFCLEYWLENNNLKKN